MSTFSEQFIQQVGNYVASLQADRPANPTTAKISSATIDSAGARTILVQFGGGTDLPAIWGSAFDMAIQVVTGGDLSKLEDAEVLLVTSTSPPYISDLIVRS